MKNKIFLKEICTRIGDGLHGTPKYAKNTDLFFINGNNLKQGKIVITKNTKSVSEVEMEKNHIELNHNTLLLSINGTLGSLAFYNKEKVILGKSTAYLNFKTEINQFYYYYFQLKSVQKYFIDQATGSTIKNLSLDSIQNFLVPYPQDSKWQGIVSTLKSLDSKIELNRKINEELEQLAKTMYDYWFVQYDFPDESGRPYKSSGGAMVFNEELGREIPLGWEVKKFGDYSKVRSGFAFKSSWWQNSGTPVVKIKDIQENYTLNLNNLSFVEKSKIEKAIAFRSKPGDIIIAMTGATIGKFAIIPYSKQAILVNQRVGLFDLGNNPFKKLPFLLNSMKQSFFRLKIFQIATGAAQPNISGNQLDNIPLVFPVPELINQYNSLIAPYYLKKINNQKETQHLTKLRDWLLPMLMNGQVVVGAN